MACYQLITVHKGGIKANGKRELIWNKKARSDDPDAFKIGCGTCIGCRLERARQWKIRCVHESKLYDENCFITLTYNDEHVPKDGSLEIRDFQLFIKRLRKAVKRPIRYFHCGEYGPELGRPHFHALIYNYNFPDKLLWKTNERGDKIYKSAELQRIWGKGFETVEELTSDSAGYVARYSLKKVYGDGKNDYYGEKRPEYVSMSKGIGCGWFEKFSGDVYPLGKVVFEGVEQKPPVYYDEKFGKMDPEGMKKIKLDRRLTACKDVAYDVKDGKEIKVPNNDSIRLQVRERIKISQIQNLKRDLEA